MVCAPNHASLVEITRDRVRGVAQAYLTLEQELPADLSQRNERDWAALSGMRAALLQCVRQHKMAKGEDPEGALFGTGVKIEVSQALRAAARPSSRMPSDMHIDDHEARGELKASKPEERAVTAVQVLQQLVDGSHHSQPTGSRRRDDPVLIEALSGAKTAAREMVAPTGRNIPIDAPDMQNARNALLDIEMRRVLSLLPRSSSIG